METIHFDQLAKYFRRTKLLALDIINILVMILLSSVWTLIYPLETFNLMDWHVERNAPYINQNEQKYIGFI